MILILFILFIRTSWVQNQIADFVADYYSEQLGTEVKVDRVKINGIDYAEVVGLNIKDQKGDTLIYAPHFSGSLAMLSLNSKFAILEAVNSEKTRIKLQKYKGDTVTNMQFVLDYFASTDSSESEFKFKINEINLLGIHFSFDNWNFPKTEYGIDYNHIDIKHLYGKINSVRTRNGVTTFQLKDIALREHSGFEVDNLSCYFLASNKKLKFENLNLLTPHSNIDIKGLSFNYHDYGDLSDFVHSVYMKGSIQPTRINLKDLSYFVPSLKEFKNNIKIEGVLDGTVSAFNIKDLYLGLSGTTFYSGELDIRGLPEIETALFYLDIYKFQTTASDLEKFDLGPLNLHQKLDLPAEVDRLGMISLNGTIDGFIDEFKTDLNLNTELGSIAANIEGGYSVDSTQKFIYDGNINVENFNLSEMLDDPSLGSINSSLSVNGEGLTIDDLDAVVIGEVDDFSLLGYNYEQINFHGKINQQKFNGRASIKDANLDLDFNGIVDFNKKVPYFNFITRIDKANLHNLNLLDRPSSSISGTLEVKNSKGLSLDDFDGQIKLSDAKYYENGIYYNFENIVINSSNAQNERSITLRSQFADMDMVGDFNIMGMDESFYSLGQRMFPSLFPYKEFKNLPDEIFDLDLTIKDLSTLTAIFYPELEVAPNSKVGLNYVSTYEMLELSAHSDWIELDDIRMVNFTIDTTQKFTVFDPFYILTVRTDSLIVGESIMLEHASIATDLYNDDAHSLIRWHAPDSSYWARLETDIDVRSISNMVLDLHPSEVYLDKIGVWHLDHDAFITMDSTSFRFKDFLATNESQSIEVKGVISEKPYDRLKVVLGQFEMNNLDPFMYDSTLYFDGQLTATGYITNVYNDLYFDAYSWIDGLKISDYPLGNLEAIAGWNPLEERIEITGDLFDSNDESSLKIEHGFYYIKKEENLDFKVSFNETDLEFANVFMPEGFSELQGYLNGNLFISGNTAEPKLDGKVDLKNAGMKIDMLNTAYYADGEILIEPDMFIINYLPIKDKLGAEGYLNGSFFHQNFEKYSYDFFAGFDEPFLVMNTNYQMNPLYYGDAFATGDVSIAYDDYNELEILVHAKSEKGTDITLPLYGSEEVELQDFITFINTGKEDEEEYTVDLEGIEMNLNLDITEDAKIQLVFDDIVGDAMQGTGNGHIEMYIDQFYDFYMFGNYEVSQGSYLFTLKDLINKKFEVKKGGTINWYGDPYEADIDLTAIYNLKTSLYDIMPENQRENYRQKTDVECEMHLTDNLFNPILGFDIGLPRSDENARSILKSMISSDAEMNKQVFSLLLLNKFLPSEYNTTGSSSDGGDAIGAMTSEVLSNQLTQIIKKFSDDFDIGFNYQPGDEITSQEVALALSTQLLDDRLTISTNLGVSHQNAGDNNNSLIGDVDVEYKLNEEGNTRVHAFNRSNEYDITQQNATYTQGVGVFYQENFDNFSELLCKLKNLFIKKENECSDCAVNCNDLLTEPEKEACKEERKRLKEECKNNKKIKNSAK